MKTISRCVVLVTILFGLNAWAADSKPDVKADTKVDLQKQIIGAWKMVSDAEGNPPQEGFDGQIKFIGDKHWTALRVDPATKKLTFVLGGTYTLKGDEYVETVEYGIEGADGMAGEKFTFKLKLQEDKLTQIGVGNPYSQIFKRAK